MLEKIKKLFRKEEAQVLEDGAIELRPVYEPGYDEETNTVIRLVSTKPAKKEAFRVTGVDDVVSKNNWKAWIYLFPVIVLLAVFSIYPLINTIFIAFLKNYVYATGANEGLTFENFGIILNLIPKNAGIPGKETMITDFVQYAIPNTLIVTFVTVPVSIFIALIISVALNSIKWFQKILQTIFFLPYVTNAIAVGMVFSVIFSNTGVINYIFNLGLFDWVKNAPREIAFVPLCINIVWKAIPFKILILLSGLQGIDKQYYQAAQIDACPKGKVLRKITVPLLSPQILYIMITSFIGSFKEYTSIVGLFNGPGTTSVNDPNMETIVYFVYNNLDRDTSLAAAAAVFLFVIILLFTALQFWASKKKVHY